MNKIYLYGFCGLLMSSYCAGMDRHPVVSNFSAGFSGENYHQVISDFHLGPYSNGIDEELLRHVYKLAVRNKRRFSSLSKGEIPELDETNLARKNKEMEKSYAKTRAYLDTYFPTDSNKQELDRYYGKHSFEYAKGPLGSLKLSISIPGRKNYVCALLDKNGWLALFQFGPQEWLHYHFYDYKHSTYSFREIRVTDAIPRVTDILVKP